MAEEKTAKPAPKAAAKPKKEKPPKLEDKPFNEFMEQHFVPALDKALCADGWDGVKLSLVEAPLAVKGADQQETYWQLQGNHPSGLAHCFNIVFAKDDIKSSKYFYCSQGDTPASTVEQFMGDERRITLDLMVMYTLQRLNGQKWLSRN
ncbi:MAG: DUF2996 domain-containing protein [Leptolyngbya sp. SIOISBB]|nr:DUF2996 domain-containing protein [Leptolyngbya sp. SIOISBB]